MAKQNLAFLYARVAKDPVVKLESDGITYKYAMVFVDVVRGLRKVDNGEHFVRHDYPLIMVKEPEMCANLNTLKENDVIFVKGVITSTRSNKKSYCPSCKDEDGNPLENKVIGNIVYVTPIFIEKIRSYDDKKQAAVEDIVAHREISNQAYVYGQLLRDPKLFITKKGVRIAQYPIAINRKYTIRTDDPSIKTDWPMVKSYGEQALSDKAQLQYQAEVIIDGVLQARTVTRKRACDCCGQLYSWQDKCMEIVPYAVEYLSGYKTEEQVEKELGMTLEDYRDELFRKTESDDDDEEFKSDDLK